MVYGVLTALVALACLGLASLAFKLKLRLLRFAVVGLAAGYAIGFVTAFVLGLLHFSLPPLQFGNAAFSASVWLPSAFGIAGMAIGTVTAMRKQSNTA